MPLKDLKKVSISEILVLVLLVIILLQKCGGGNKETVVEPKIFRDTVWIHKDNTITSKPEVIKTIPYSVPIDRWNTEYLPDTSEMSNLVKQYEALVRELLAKNINVDSLTIDSIGHIYITDTVSKNMITGRSTHYNLKYPSITTTIIVPEPKKTQWYYGGFVQGEKGNLIDEIGAGLLIKNKRDQIFGGHVGLSNSGNLQVGVSSYWKIKLKK